MNNSEKTLLIDNGGVLTEMNPSEKPSKKRATKKSASTKPKPKFPLVEVWWDDAAGLRHGWEKEIEKLEPQDCVSVGFLIYDGPDHLILAMDVDCEGQHNGRSQIPKGMIKDVKTLRKAAK